MRNPYDEPCEWARTTTDLDRLREESIIITNRGWYLQRIGPDDWAEPGNAEMYAAEDISLPALVLFEPQR